MGTLVERLQSLPGAPQAQRPKILEEALRAVDSGRYKGAFQAPAWQPSPPELHLITRRGLARRRACRRQRVLPGPGTRIGAAAGAGPRAIQRPGRLPGAAGGAVCRGGRGVGARCRRPPAAAGPPGGGSGARGPGAGRPAGPAGRAGGGAGGRVPGRPQDCGHHRGGRQRRRKRQRHGGGPAAGGSALRAGARLSAALGPARRGRRGGGAAGCAGCQIQRRCVGRRGGWRSCRGGGARPGGQGPAWGNRGAAPDCHRARRPHQPALHPPPSLLR